MTAIPKQKEYIRASDILPNIPTYTEHDITPDGRFLEIELASQKFPLELRNVGTEENPAFIAWMDTHPDHPHVPQGLAHAAAVERAQLLVKMRRHFGQDVQTIVTAASTKSIPSIQETVKIASVLLGYELNLVILLGGSDKNEVAKHSMLPPIAYVNVTSHGQEKYVGITEHDASLLRHTHASKKGIWEMDDIYTTGGTSGGVQKTINEALGIETEIRRPLIVVARESPYDKQYPHTAPDYVFALCHLPEFIHRMPTALQKR